MFSQIKMTNFFSRNNKPRNPSNQVSMSRLTQLNKNKLNLCDTAIFALKGLAGAVATLAAVYCASSAIHGVDATDYAASQILTTNPIEAVSVVYFGQPRTISDSQRSENISWLKLNLAQSVKQYRENLKKGNTNTDDILPLDNINIPEIKKISLEEKMRTIGKEFAYYDKENSAITLNPEQKQLISLYIQLHNDQNPNNRIPNNFSSQSLTFLREKGVLKYYFGKENGKTVLMRVVFDSSPMKHLFAKSKVQSLAHLLHSAQVISAPKIS
jgi:hypothetical protein